MICILVLLAVIFGITNLSINDIAEAAASKVEQGVTYVKHKSKEKARVRREYIAEREAEEAQREMFIAGGENDKTIVSPQKKKRRGKSERGSYRRQWGLSKPRGRLCSFLAQRLSAYVFKKT